MTVPVTIIDYGVGNLLNVVRAFEHVGATVTVAASKEAIQRAGALVLPGVGAFHGGMAELEKKNMLTVIKNHADAGKKLLGVCLGMQMLFDSSDEFGFSAGLGLIPGRVIPIPECGTNGQRHKIPHIGWNELLADDCLPWKGTVLNSIPPGRAAYFVHSLMAVPEEESHRLAYCHYDGVKICAAVQKDNLIGCQFHPEKSGEIGLSILSGFLEYSVG